jgi:hypothetical protein
LQKITVCSVCGIDEQYAIDNYKDVCAANGGWHKWKYAPASILDVPVPNDVPMAPIFCKVCGKYQANYANLKCHISLSGEHIWSNTVSNVTPPKKPKPETTGGAFAYHKAHAKIEKNGVIHIQSKSPGQESYDTHDIPVGDEIQYEHALSCSDSLDACITESGKGEASWAGGSNTIYYQLGVTVKPDNTKAIITICGFVLKTLDK